MKKILIILTAFVSASSFAGTFSGRDYSKFCRGQKTANYGETLLCTQAAEYRVVIAGKAGGDVRPPAKVINRMLDPIYDLEVLPDDSTSGIYRYTKSLNDRNGRLVGYYVISGYINTEIETRVKVVEQYNVSGELVSAAVSSF
ncbi:MAG: hypothetical protein JST80_02350 [Bdellovibrionales bacterium]|nr:hypothetical protein [Bdellovibrionales bacterium]